MSNPESVALVDANGAVVIVSLPGSKFWLVHDGPVDNGEEIVGDWIAVGVLAGELTPYGTVQVRIFTDQGGTAFLEGRIDGGEEFTLDQTVYGQAAPTPLKAGVLAEEVRLRLVGTLESNRTVAVIGLGPASPAAQ